MERCEIVDIEEALGDKKIRRPFRKCNLKKIPGFRTGNKVHMTLAIINNGYMIMLFLIYCWIKSRWIDYVIGIAGLGIMTLGMGYFVGDFRKIAYRLHMDRGIKKGILITGYVIVGCIIWTAGFVMMLWSDPTLG